MNPANPYRSALADNAQEQIHEKSNLPIWFPVLAILDVVTGFAVAYAGVYTGMGLQSFFTVLLVIVPEALGVLLLIVSLLAAPILLVLRRNSAWKAMMVAQCTQAFLVLFTYAWLVFVLISRWGESNMMWSGGNWKLLVIVTSIYLVLQALAVASLFILYRNRPASRSI